MKEIIIDGVNVAECDYYKGKCMEYTHYCQIGCKECTDIETKLCHYKQTERFKAKIARIEQENEKLKKQVENFKKMFEEQFEYKEINLKKLEEIRELCTNYAKTESYIIDETFSEFLEIVFNKADEVLK